MVKHEDIITSALQLPKSIICILWTHTEIFVNHLMRVMRRNNSSFSNHVVRIYRENVFHHYVAMSLVCLQAHLAV